MDDQRTSKEIVASIRIKYNPDNSVWDSKPHWFIMQLHPATEDQKYGILFFTQLYEANSTV